MSYIKHIAITITFVLSIPVNELFSKPENTLFIKIAQLR
jgi:hypothetical protein